MTPDTHEWAVFEEGTQFSIFVSRSNSCVREELSLKQQRAYATKVERLFLKAN